MKLKSGIILLLFFGCFVYRGNAQYALQVGDKFIPIANDDKISKQILLNADTVRVMYLAPGATEPSEMQNIIIVVKQNGENAGAYIYPSGIFGKEVLEKINNVNSDCIIIGQKKPLKETPNGVMARSKGPTIVLRLKP